MLKKRMATIIVVIALVLGIALLFPACNKNKSGKESPESSGTTVSVEEPRDYDGLGGPQDDASIPTGPSYFYATSNLRLRSEPDTSKDNRIAGITQGGRVELIELGQSETIDNMNARWFKVKTEDGTVGWLFSGYLTSDPAVVFGSYDYSKLLKGDFSDFSYTAGDWGAKDGSGERMRLNADGTVIDDTAADGEWVTQLRFGGIGDRGEYNGGIGSQNKKTGEGGGGAAAQLWPIGVVIGDSDVTKVRLWTGQDSSPNTYVSELIYFRKKSGAAAPVESYDYAKILNKDFSDFAGNWKNGNGDRQQLKNDGIFGVNGREIFTPKHESNGAYSWIVGSGQDGWHMKLYPVGTAVPGVQSDTTKVRLTMVMTPDGTASQAEIYYKD